MTGRGRQYQNTLAEVVEAIRTRPTMAAAALHLGIHPVTLGRRIKEEGLPKASEIRGLCREDAEVLLASMGRCAGTVPPADVEARKMTPAEAAVAACGGTYRALAEVAAKHGLTMTRVQQIHHRLRA